MLDKLFGGLGLALGAFLSLGMVAGLLALYVWAFYRVIKRARVQGRNVAGIIVASLLITPFAVLVATRELPLTASRSGERRPVK